VTAVRDPAPPDEPVAAASQWDAATDWPEPTTASRPPRPVLIELAGAVLIVSALVRLFVVALAIGAPPEAGVEATPTRVLIESLLQLLTIVTGALVRSGRAWVLVVNVVAVLAFIQIISVVGVVSLTFALLFAAASVIVYANRPWFEAMADWRAARRIEQRR
jgi:hypothetical protein